MILKILLILLLVGLLFVLIALLAPICFVFSTKENVTKNSIFLLYVFHPSVFRVAYQLSGKKMEFSLFNLFHYPSRKKDMPGDDEPVGEELPVEEEDDIPVPEEEYSTFDMPEEEKELEEKIPEEEEPEPIRSFQEEEPTPEYTPPPPEEIEEIKEKSQIEDEPTQIDQKEEPVDEKIEEEKKTGFFAMLEKGKQIYRFVIGQKKIARKSLRWIVRLCKRLLKVIKFNYFVMDVKAGFEDPTYTGICYGVFESMYHSLDIEDSRRARLSFEPYFENRDIIEFEGAISLRTSLFRFVFPVIEAVLLFPYISAFLLWRRIKKFKKSFE